MDRDRFPVFAFKYLPSQHRDPGRPKCHCMIKRIFPDSPSQTIWSSSKPGRRLQARRLKNNILKQVFELKRAEIGDSRKIHNEKQCDCAVYC